MQQLEIEHKKITTNPVVENTIKKDRRESKGQLLALSHNVYRLLNSDVFYVESESRENVYYYVKFKPDVFEWCSCPDNSTRQTTKCKHLFAIEFAIRMGTLLDIDKLPAEAKRYPAITATTAVQSKSYKDDDYTF
jgi:predicted nucleic acid-binding Zn finger protein